MATSNDNAAPNGGKKVDPARLWEQIDVKVSQAEGVCAVLVAHPDMEGDMSNAVWAAETLLAEASGLLADLHKHLPKAASGDTKILKLLGDAIGQHAATLHLLQDWDVSAQPHDLHARFNAIEASARNTERLLCSAMEAADA